MIATPFIHRLLLRDRERHGKYLCYFVWVVALFHDRVGCMLEQDHRREAPERIWRAAQNFHLVAVDIELQEIDGFEVKIGNDFVARRRG